MLYELRVIPFSDLRSEPPKAERIADDRDGTHGHGGRGDHGVQEDSKEWVEDARGDRNSQDIKNKGPEEILPDGPDRPAAQLDGGHHGPEVSGD